MADVDPQTKAQLMQMFGPSSLNTGYVPPDRSAAILAAAEAHPDSLLPENRNALGQDIRSRRSAIAPPQPVPTFHTETTTNALGQPVQQQVRDSAPLFQNPFARPSAPPVLESTNINRTDSLPAQENPAAAAPMPGAAGAAQPGMGVPRNPIVVPGGWQGHSRSVHEGMYIDPEAQKQLEKAQAEEANWAQRAAVHGQQVAVEQAAYQQTAAQLAQQQADQDQLRQADRQRRVNEHMAKYDAVAQQLGTGQIDPDRSWNSRSAASKAAAVVGMIFGNFGGNGNAALQVLEKEQDADIKAQQATFDNARGKLGEERNMFGQMMGLYKDEDMAIAATRAAQWEAAKAQLQAQLAKLSPQEAEIKGGQALADINAKIASAKMDLANKAHDQVVRSDVYRPTQVVGGGPKPQQGQEGLFIPQFNGFARTEHDRNEILSRLTSIANIQSGLDRLNQLGEQYGGWERAKNVIGASTVNDMIKGQIAELMPQVSVAFGQGALADAEAERYKQVIGDPTKFLTDQKKVTENFRSRLSQMANNMKDQYGVRSGTAQIVYDPTKQRNVEVGELTGKIAAPNAIRSVKRTAVGGGP